MFLVGGGILAHGVPALHHVIEETVHGLPRLAAGATTMLINAVIGIVAGLVVVAVVMLVQRLRGKPADGDHD
jgi:predicted DNA repair protein MutK